MKRLLFILLIVTIEASSMVRFGIDWHDSGARSQTMNGIFTGIDPFAEKY